MKKRTLAAAGLAMIMAVSLAGCSTTVSVPDTVKVENVGDSSDGKITMVIYIKVGVFRGGGNEGDSALLNTFQQALLLTLVKILDLVQIQQNAARRPQCADVCEHGLDVAG